MARHRSESRRHALTLPHRRHRIRDLDRAPCHVGVQALLLRDMERVCSLCHHKARCNLEFVTGTVVENYHGYCNKASTLETLDRAEITPH